MTRINTKAKDWEPAFWEYLSAWIIDTDTLALRLPELQQPTLVITGDSDSIVPVEDSERLASEIPNADIVILPACGHVPQEECPDAFAEAVGAWLTQWSTE